MIRNTIFAAALAAVLAVPASAGAAPRPAIQLANTGCGAAIARVEAQTGGKVLSADLIAGGGSPRCRLVVLVPSNNRSRPPKPQVMVVPAG